MLGKTINNICKICKTVNPIVPTTAQLEVVDRAHVCLLRVETLDNTPVFGVDHKGSVDVSEILKAKIPNDEDFKIIIDNYDNNLKIFNDNYMYIFPTGKETETAKIKLDYSDVYDFDVKKLLNMIDYVRTKDDRIVISGDNNTKLRASCDFANAFVTISEQSCFYKTRGVFDANYLHKVVKQIKSKEATMYIESDYPLKIKWTDGNHKFSYLLAGRVEYD